MNPNLTKCEQLTITNTKNPINSSYCINSHFLSKVKSANYLGVAITHSLYWHDHMMPFVVKLNQRMLSCKEILDNVLLRLNQLLT